VRVVHAPEGTSCPVDAVTSARGLDASHHRRSAVVRAVPGAKVGAVMAEGRVAVDKAVAKVEPAVVLAEPVEKDHTMVVAEMEVETAVVVRAAVTEGEARVEVGRAGGGQPEWQRA
jgi:hypothetical protein